MIDIAKVRGLKARSQAAMQGKRTSRVAVHHGPKKTQRYGDGPGSLMSERLKSWGFKGCSACNKTAKKMDEWGPEKCAENRDALVEEILPRAKKWIRSNAVKEAIANAMSLVSLEDTSHRLVVGHLIDWAIIECLKRRQVRSVDVLQVSRETVQQWREDQNGLMSVLAGGGVTCQSVYLSDGDSLPEIVGEASPKVCLIRNFPFSAEQLKPVAERFRDVKFIVCSHGFPSALVVWRQALGEFADYIGLAHDLPNVWLGCSSDEVPIGEFTPRTIWIPNTAGSLGESPDTPPVGPLNLSLVGRWDIVKNFPNQVMAAALANKTRRCRLHVMVQGMKDDHELVQFAEMCGLEVMLHGWADHVTHRGRVAGLIDIGLQATFTETFNYVAFEHLALGKPVVGSSTIRFLPDEMVADPNDIRGMADMIVRHGARLDADTREFKEQCRSVAGEVADRHAKALVSNIKELL